MSCTCKPDEGIEYMCRECYFAALAAKASEGVQPPVAEEETPITVQELRDLVYPHGKAVSVLVTWTRGHWQMVTAGATRKDADKAVYIREQIEKLLELGPMQTIEDRRHEHRK